MKFHNIMSRIGKKIIELPEKVSVETRSGLVVVKGPKGELNHSLPNGLKIKQDGNNLSVELIDETDATASFWGTTRALIAGMVKGVAEGYEKKLEIEGVGFKAQLQGGKLVLNVGFSHPVEFKVPTGVNLKVEKNTIVINGLDKFLVGETAAKIREIKKPEPYKGKGIRYAGENIRRKAGKKASTSA